MGEARGEITVAREQQQSFRIEIEPADRIDIAVHASLGEEVDHRGPMLGIRPARDVAARLVEEDVAIALDFGSRRPSTLISSAAGSAFDPSSVTVLPLTVTRPWVMSVSAVRRDATPAAERIF